VITSKLPGSSVYDGYVSHELTDGGRHFD
jgi:hypothetical protein